MPLVQIDVDAGVSEQLRAEIAEGVNRALVAALGMPAADRFQIGRRHDAGELVFDQHYLGVDRRQVIFIQILMVRMYDEATKAAMCRQIAAELGELGIRRDDIFVAVTENTVSDWWVGTK